MMRVRVPVTAISPIESAMTKLAVAVVPSDAVMVARMSPLGVELLTVGLAIVAVRVVLHPHLVSFIHTVVLLDMLLLVLSDSVPLLLEHSVLARLRYV